MTKKHCIWGGTGSRGIGGRKENRAATDGGGEGLRKIDKNKQGGRGFWEKTR